MSRQDLEDRPFLILGNLVVIIIIILLPHSAQHSCPRVMAARIPCVEGEMFPRRVRLAAELHLFYKTVDVWVGKCRAISWEYPQEACWDGGSKVQKI